MKTFLAFATTYNLNLHQNDIKVCLIQEISMKIITIHDSCSSKVDQKGENSNREVNENDEDKKYFSILGQVASYHMAG